MPHAPIEDAELAWVVAVWGGLPRPIRAAVLALVRSATEAVFSGGGPDDCGDRA